jgi:hypothetical protein
VVGKKRKRDSIDSETIVHWFNDLISHIDASELAIFKTMVTFEFKTRLAELMQVEAYCRDIIVKFYIQLSEHLKDCNAIFKRAAGDESGRTGMMNMNLVAALEKMFRLCGKYSRTLIDFESKFCNNNTDLDMECDEYSSSDFSSSSKSPALPC